jgi:hypothetical protein
MRPLRRRALGIGEDPKLLIQGTVCDLGYGALFAGAQDGGFLIDH